jgi:hypothetical protein
MSETKREYAANYRKPPLRTRFKKERSGNPGGRSKKKLHALLAAPAAVTLTSLPESREKNRLEP